MRILTSLAVRLRALLGRRQFDAELDEELRYHLDRETERNVAKGLPAPVAREMAKRSLGNLTVVAEQARDAARWRLVEEAWQDSVYAIRTFRRAPAFVIGVVATIGLGLGLLATAFTFFDAYVLRTMAVREPLSLFDASWHARNGQSHAFTWSQYQRLSRTSSVFAESFAYSTQSARLHDAPAVGQLVSGNYFEVLGVPPAFGRVLVPADAATPNDGAVIVLSHDMWKRAFGGDSNVVGTTLLLGGVRFTIVGVARRGFGGLTTRPLDFWVPLSMGSAFGHAEIFATPEAELLGVVGRVRRGSSVDATSSALKTWLAAETADSSVIHRVNDVALFPRGTAIPRSTEAIELFAPIVAAFGLVMLIACANVANLMLARGMARQREIGIRLSLGADRPRVVRQLLIEALLLAAPATVCGLLVSRLAVEGGIWLMFATVPPAYVTYLRLIPLDADAAVIAFMMLVAICAAIGFGLVPALQATRTSVVQASKGDFDAPTRRRHLSDGLAVAQICLSVMLLICAAMLLRLARNTSRADPGFDASSLLHIAVSEKAREHTFELLAKRGDVTGIASAVSSPLDGAFNRMRISVNKLAQTASFNIVSPEYFSVVGLPITNGRVFTNEEAMARADVAIISQSTAHKLWPSGQAIGQTITTDRPTAGAATLIGHRELHVIGVVGDAVPGIIPAGREALNIYLPQPLHQTTATILARVSGNISRLSDSLEHDVRSFDPGASEEVHSVESSRVLQVYPFEAVYWIASALGAVALALTLCGVYSVLSYLVAQRRKELGIRSALGANASTLVRLVLGRGIRLAVFGVIAGLIAAFGASKLIGAMLPIETFDPIGFASGATVVFVACLAAAYVPSARAGRVDPVDVLRVD